MNLKIISPIILTIFIVSLFVSSCSDTKSKSDKSMTISDLNSKIEDNPNDLLLLEERTKFYIQKSNLNNAIADLHKSIEIAPDSIKYYMKLSDIFMQLGQVQNSLSILKKVTELDKSYEDAWIKLGEIHLMYRKYQDVFNYANKALDANPYSDIAYFLKAYTYKEMKDTNMAIQSFQQCLKNNPQNYNANIELGILFMSLKNTLAISYFKNAIAIDSTKVDAYYDLGLYYQNNDYLNEAIEIYKQLIEINPKFPSSYYNIGYIYLELLNISDKAIPYFTKSILAKPDYYEAYYNRALAFEKLGDVFNAKKDYQEALRLKPNYDKAIEGLNRIEN
jgi:tetratricopeptide (TPR) repeat protein